MVAAASASVPVPGASSAGAGAGAGARLPRPLRVDGGAPCENRHAAPFSQLPMRQYLHGLSLLGRGGFFSMDPARRRGVCVSSFLGCSSLEAERGRVASFEPARRRGFGLFSFSGVGALSSGALAAGALAAAWPWPRAPARPPRRRRLRRVRRGLRIALPILCVRGF